MCVCVCPSGSSRRRAFPRVCVPAGWNQKCLRSTDNEDFEPIPSSTEELSNSSEEEGSNKKVGQVSSSVITGERAQSTGEECVEVFISRTTTHTHTHMHACTHSHITHTHHPSTHPCTHKSTKQTHTHARAHARTHTHTRLLFDTIHSRAC